MATRNWSFTINTFDVNTRGSNVKMLSLATDTHAKLMNENGDPDILNLFNILDPQYNNYRQVCINYDMVEGNYGGGTLAFENLLDTLPRHLRIWESGVRAVHYEDSPEEKAIFPSKRNPFLKGTYEERLIAIGALAKRLSSEPDLDDTYTLVNNFHVLALSTRLAQQQDEGAIAQMSDLREQQRKLVAEALFGVLGGLILKFRATPKQVNRFFDLELLRRKGAGQVTGPGTIKGLVRNAATGAPIGGARVALRTSEGEVVIFTPPSGAFTHTTADLTEAIEMEVEVSAPGLVPRTLDIVVEPASEPTIEVELTPVP